MAALTLSIIILNWNTCALLRDCLRALGALPPDWELIIVDNASTDGSADMVARDFPAVQLIRNPENLGFARANNQGLCLSQRQYVLLLNSDTVVKPGALTALVRFMDEHPKAGVVSPRLLCPDGAPQPYAFGGDPTLWYLLRRGVNQLLFHRYLHDWATGLVQEVDWVSGACMLVRREAIEQVGLLDENMFMYFEDNDWCLRMRKAGWKVYYNPQVEITHIGGQSLAKNPKARKAYYSSLRYFYARHYSPVSRFLLDLFLVPYQWIMRR